MKIAKEEIRATEEAFAQMAASEGLSAAFARYADTSAVLNRGTYLIHGRDSIRQFYRSPRYQNVKLQWSPDFIEVSSSADLGYTYGRYTFTAPDSTGNPVSSNGYFHTVWKRQSDGSWLFVWD